MADAPSHNLVAVLADRAAEHPRTPAFIAGRTRDAATTYAELWERIGHAAAGLESRGIGHGDHVLLLQNVSIDLYVALSAAWRVGAVACLIDPGVGLRRFESMARRLAPAAVIGPGPLLWLRWLSPTLRRAPVAASVDTLARPSGTTGAPPAISPVGPDHPALVTFTSGSTGEPKCIARSHALLAAQLAALREGIALEPGERDLLTLPAFALANLACGLTTVIPNVSLRRVGRVDPRSVLAQAERVGVDRCTASPAFFEPLLAHTEATRGPLPFKKVYTGGAPVFPRLLDRLARAMPPDATISAVYGSTEAEPIAELDRRDITDTDAQAIRQGAGLPAGRPSPHVRLRIIATPPTSEASLDPNAFDRLECDVDQPGEIVVAGDHVVPAYLDGIGDASIKLRVGSTVWHRTGDLGYLDRKGRLWLLGRREGAVCDERGESYAFGVEAIAMADSDVARAAFVGLDGVRVLAVEPQPQATVDTLLARLRANPALRIDHAIAVRRIPVDRRHNAKVDYPALRKAVRRTLRHA